jgi:hypothetical protein
MCANASVNSLPHPPKTLAQTQSTGKRNHCELDPPSSEFCSVIRSPECKSFYHTDRVVSTAIYRGHTEVRVRSDEDVRKGLRSRLVLTLRQASPESGARRPFAALTG